MTAGILQLAAYGMEDAFLSGNPQISFFRTVYRRHTNFSREEKNLKFFNRLDFGKESKCKIQKFGDLLHRLFLVVNLPEIQATYEQLTIGQVIALLATYGIIWTTTLNVNSYLTEDTLVNIIEPLIAESITNYNNDVTLINEILALFTPTGILSASTFLENTNFTNKNVTQYISTIFNYLFNPYNMFDDKYQLEYNYVVAYAADALIQNNGDEVLNNLNEIINILYNAFIDYAIGVITISPVFPYSISSEQLVDNFIPQNLYFMYEVSIANYAINGDSNYSVFQSAINNIYGVISGGQYVYAGLDSYDIFTATLLANPSVINTSRDVQLVITLLLNNIRYGLLQNPIQLNNVYESLVGTFSFIFYKKFLNNGTSITPSGNFVNLSQVNTNDPLLSDNFTSIFIVPPYPGDPLDPSTPVQPSDVTVQYINYVTQQVSTFHGNDTNTFNNSIYTNYLNNYNLWLRFNMGAPSDYGLQNAVLPASPIIPVLDPNQTVIGILNPLYPGILNTQAYYNELNLPNSSALIGILDLSYIPLFMNLDIPNAIVIYLNNRGIISATNSVFCNTILNLLATTQHAIMTTLNGILAGSTLSSGPYKDVLVTMVELSNYLVLNPTPPTTPIGGNLLQSAIIMLANTITSYTGVSYPHGTKLSPPSYVYTYYYDQINAMNFTTLVGNDPLGNPYIPVNEKSAVLQILGLFVTPTINIPASNVYITQNYNQVTNVTINGQILNLSINNGLATALCDIPSSIWFNILNGVIANYNNLYDNGVLSPSYFTNSIGAEMTEYLTYISDTYFSSGTINYWFDTPISQLPGQSPGNIGIYLQDQQSIFLTQLEIYDANLGLLSMINIPINTSQYYFADYDTIINYFVNIIQANPTIYYHQDYLQPNDPVVLISNALINQTLENIYEENQIILTTYSSGQIYVPNGNNQVFPDGSASFNSTMIGGIIEFNGSSYIIIGFILAGGVLLVNPTPPFTDQANYVIYYYGNQLNNTVGNVSDIFDAIYNDFLNVFLTYGPDPYDTSFSYSGTDGTIFNGQHTLEQFPGSFNAQMIGGTWLFESILYTVIQYVTPDQLDFDLNFPFTDMGGVNFTINYSTSPKYSGTGSQAGITVTGVGTNFTSIMVNGVILYANGAQATINIVVSSTELITSQYLNVAEQTFTVYYVSGITNRNVLWLVTFSGLYIPTPPNISTEATNWETLFGAIFANPETYFFNDINNIVNNYNGFANASDLYQYMENIIIANSEFSVIDTLQGNSVNQMYNNIVNYYTTTLATITNQLEKLGPDGINLITILTNSLNGVTPADFAWIERLGHYLIDEMSVYIGDELVDKQYGEWLELWHELTKRREKERGYKNLIGDIKVLTTYNANMKPNYQMMIPLQFWFCKHIGMALPIVSLLHSDIEVVIRMESFTDVSYTGSNYVTYNGTPRLDCELMCEYIFVEQEERLRIAQSKMEYLMETLQVSNDYVITSATLANGITDLVNNVFVSGLIERKLYFDNPIKELIWILQDTSFVDGSQENGAIKYNNYSVNFMTGIGNAMQNAKIQFSGRDREIFKDVKFYNYIYPWERHTSTPSDGINNYSFSLSPEVYQPSGSANFSRLDDSAIIVQLTDDVINNIKNNNLQLRFAIYAPTYNVLRIISGQAGLAFYK